MAYGHLRIPGTSYQKKGLKIKSTVNITHNIYDNNNNNTTLLIRIFSLYFITFNNNTQSDRQTILKYSNESKRNLRVYVEKIVCKTTTTTTAQSILSHTKCPYNKRYKAWLLKYHTNTRVYIHKYF